MSSKDSDSESLPDLSEIITTTKPKTDISAGDIVWAKFRNLYWPALVRHIYSKEKKITVWYADEPGKTFKIPFKNVCLFHDQEMRMKIEKDVREAGCVTEHDGLTSHAPMYLRRKAEGYNDDPIKFFDQTYPFYLMENMLKKNPNMDVSSIKIPHLYITPEKKLSRKKVASIKEASDAEESSIEECVSSDESESRPSNQPKDYLLKVKQEYSSVVNSDKDIDEIVFFIKSGKADVHLKKIQSKHISSMYRNIYEKSIKSNKQSVAPVTYTGPIENDEKLRELIFHLLDFHDKHIRNPKNKPCRKSNKLKLMECTVSDKKSQNAQYVGSVLLPEAIIYAMSKIKKVTLTRAKQLFQKESESKTDAIEKIIACLGCEETKNTSESFAPKNEEESDEGFTEKNDLHTSSMENNNHETSSPLKKLCVG